MKHHKKRNTGLIYEFLVRRASEGLVEGDKKKIDQVVKLMKKHFREGTELHRELRLFCALVETYVNDRSVADRIISSCRDAARGYDSARLDREKSLLIRNINHTFNDATFYDRRVNEYKLYATIQMLLNEWRQPVPSDVVKVAFYESDLIEHLMTPKKKNALDEYATNVHPETDDITVGLMLKKVNDRYKGLFNANQITLLNSYVAALQANNGMERVVEAAEKLRVETLDVIKGYLASPTKDPDIAHRLEELKAFISTEVKQVDDATLSRCLRLAGLKQEIEEY